MIAVAVIALPLAVSRATSLPRCQASLGRLRRFWDLGTGEQAGLIRTAVQILGLIEAMGGCENASEIVAER